MYSFPTAFPCIPSSLIPDPHQFFLTLDEVIEECYNLEDRFFGLSAGLGDVLETYIFDSYEFLAVEHELAVEISTIWGQSCAVILQISLKLPLFTHFDLELSAVPSNKFNIEIILHLFQL